MTEEEMVGWSHQLNGHEFEQTPGDSEGRKPGMLQSMGLQKLGTTEHLNNSNESKQFISLFCRVTFG